jgi:serine/threonine-protein kinase
VKREERPTAGVEPGSVVDTQPVEGAPLTPGDTITVIVATQPETLTVPDLTGKNGLVAAAELQKAGFPQLGITQQREKSDTIGPNLVIRTEPPAGATVPFAEAAITVWFSDGPDTFPVPNVVGSTEAAALSQLQSDPGAFVRGVVTQTTTCTAGDNGKVMSQDPGAGTRVKPNTPVNLAVCQRTDTTTTVAPAPTPAPPAPTPPAPTPPPAPPPAPPST